MNLELDFGAPEEAAAPNPARGAWAGDVLALALASNKTRLKAVRADDALLQQTTDAILTVAEAKAASYAAARAGHGPNAAAALFNWIGKRAALAAAMLALSAAAISPDDVPMFPQNLT